MHQWPFRVIRARFGAQSEPVSVSTVGNGRRGAYGLTDLCPGRVGFERGCDRGDIGCANPLAAPFDQGVGDKG